MAKRDMGSSNESTASQIHEINETWLLEIYDAMILYS